MAYCHGGSDSFGGGLIVLGEGSTATILLNNCNGAEAIFEIIQREDARNLPYDLQDEAWMLKGKLWRMFWIH